MGEIENKSSENGEFLVSAMPSLSPVFSPGAPPFPSLEDYQITENDRHQELKLPKEWEIGCNGQNRWGPGIRIELTWSHQMAKDLVW